jgi:hypothetical protein
LGSNVEVIEHSDEWLGDRSVVKLLFSKHKVLGLIPSTTKTERERERPLNTVGPWANPLTSLVLFSHL